MYQDTTAEIIPATKEIVVYQNGDLIPSKTRPAESGGYATISNGRNRPIPLKKNSNRAA